MIICGIPGRQTKQRTQRLKKNTVKFSDFMQLIRLDFKILMTITQLQIRGNRSGRREKRGYREQNSTGDF